MVPPFVQVAYKGLHELEARSVEQPDWGKALQWAEQGRSQALQQELLRTGNAGSSASFKTPPLQVHAVLSDYQLSLSPK